MTKNPKNLFDEDAFRYNWKNLNEDELVNFINCKIANAEEFATMDFVCNLKEIVIDKIPLEWEHRHGWQAEIDYFRKIIDVEYERYWNKRRARD